MATRKEIAQKEMTRDPIFLFQTQRVYPTGDYYFGDYFYCHDCEEIIEGDENEHQGSPHHQLGVVISEAEGIKRGILSQAWETRLVFYTREEAEEFGRQNSHNYDPFRVFCVPAHGELITVLSDVPVT